MKKMLGTIRVTLALMLALACVALLAACSGSSAPAGNTGSTTGNSAGDGNTPAQTEGSSAAPSKEALAFWNGDWYGWWTWENGTGDAEAASGGRWDCMAHFATGSDGKGHVVIWDGDWAKDDGVSEVDYTIKAEGGDLGTLVSDSGWFIDHDAFIASGAWTLSSASLLAPDLVQIKGHYVSSNDSSTAMDYTIYLRPWGATWDNLPIDQPKNLDWYLSLVNAGTSMPDTIG